MAIDPASRHSTQWGWRGQRCWATAWVIDLDIKGFFDSLDHALVERAVAHHTDIPWVRSVHCALVTAPVQRPDGTLEQRTRGTPQGGVVSPLLANLFLHYAFDIWMQRHFPGVRFERYADDAIVHCRTEQEARAVLDAIRGRFEQCRLELHPLKTRIVYCKRDGRPGDYANMSRSTSWGTPSNLVGRRIAGGNASSASSRPSVRRPPRRFGPRFATGAWPPPGTTNAWRTSRNSSTP